MNSKKVYSNLSDLKERVELVRQALTTGILKDQVIIKGISLASIRMKLKLIIIVLLFIGCNLPKVPLTTTEKNMIPKLEIILQENKFTEGANGWKSYTGCKNLEERNAYSKNIDKVIIQLIEKIKGGSPQKILLQTLNEFNIKAETLEDNYRADTDESEIRFLYFERIRKIIIA